MIWVQDIDYNYVNLEKAHHIWVETTKYDTYLIKVDIRDKTYTLEECDDELQVNRYFYAILEDRR